MPDDVAFQSIDTYAMVFVRRQVLADESAEVSAILDGSVEVSEFVARFETRAR